MEEPTTQAASIEMPRYRSHKTVYALKIKYVIPADSGPSDVILHFEEAGYVPRTVSVANRPNPLPGWYYVVYDNGYHSFSPADAFEQGNKLETIPGPSKNAVMKYFAFAQLPPKLQEISEPIAALAQAMEVVLTDGPEKSAGLRKLLEAKDCFVRAMLP